MTQSSNASRIVDNIVPGEGHETFAVSVGGTGIANDFSPVLNAQSLGLGDIFVDAFILEITTNSSTPIFDNNTSLLPQSNTIFDPQTFLQSNLVLGFGGDNIDRFGAIGTV